MSKKDVKKAEMISPEVEAALSENEKLKETVMRLNAEMQNMNRHFNEEREKLCKYDGEKLIKELLPIIDNFERAIKVDENLNEELTKYLLGFKMIYTSLLSILNSMGVHEIEALGKQFDPVCMDAIMTEKDTELESNIVLDVMQKGYIYNDRVIRPAMVKVNE